MTHVSRNTGTSKKDFNKVTALDKKKRIENLSKKVRKGKATEAEKKELASLKK